MVELAPGHWFVLEGDVKKRALVHTFLIKKSFRGKFFDETALYSVPTFQKIVLSSTGSRLLFFLSKFRL